MSPEKWLQIKTIFNQAIELEAVQHGEFLQNVEPVLRAEVSRLLEAEKQSNFAEPVANLPHIWQEELAENYLGKEIGNYRTEPSNC